MNKYIKPTLLRNTIHLTPPKLTDMSTHMLSLRISNATCHSRTRLRSQIIFSSMMLAFYSVINLLMTLLLLRTRARQAVRFERQTEFVAHECG